MLPIRKPYYTYPVYSQLQSEPIKLWLVKVGYERLQDMSIFIKSLKVFVYKGFHVLFE